MKIASSRRVRMRIRDCPACNMLHGWSRWTYEYKYLTQHVIWMTCNETRLTCLETTHGREALLRFRAWLWGKWKHFLKITRFRWTYWESEKWKRRHARRRGGARYEKRASHAARGAQKKTSATQGENAIFSFCDTPAARTSFLKRRRNFIEPKKCSCCCWRELTKMQVSKKHVFIQALRSKWPKRKNERHARLERDFFSLKKGSGGGQNLGFSLGCSHTMKKWFLKTGIRAAPQAQSKHAGGG